MDCIPLYDRNPIVILFQVVTVTLHFVTASRFMMNWVTVFCFAVFLSCQYSVGHGKNVVPGGPIPLSREDFDREFYDQVTPVIGQEFGCPSIELTYINGTSQVCIRLRPSSLVFCTLD